jgi:ATP-dependent exoDNAse (exonuclease V) beta subunit
VAVLAPRNDWLETAATEFARAGLPVGLFSTKQTARAQPVQSWPAALLHVLLHPWDRFELIGVLREIFAVSDVDLARLHRRGGSGLAFWPAIPVAAGGVPSAGLGQALSLLRELRAALPPASVSSYLDLVLERTALAARLEAVEESADGLETLRARALRAECEGMSLRDWVDHLVQSLDDPAPSAAGPGDAIQLVTCHKAKGLEWPVVLTLGMGAHLKERSTSFPLVEATPDGPRVHLTQVTMDTARKEAQSIQSREEYQRLLYVTLTRAKHILIVPDGKELHKSGSPNFLELARWQALDLPALFSPPPGPDEMAPVEGDHRASKSQEPALLIEDPALMARAASISQSAPRRLLPSGEVHHAAAIEEVPEPVVLPASAEGGTGYGDWWHTVLQGYPWTGKPAERAECLATAAASLAADCPWRDRGKAELERLASSAAHAEFLAQGAVFLPEMPFAYPRNAEVWIEGIMDLVIVTKEGSLWIVDWKTDRRPPSDPGGETFLGRLAAKYAPQLAPYAEVGAQGLGRPVARLLIYSTVAGALADVAGNVFVSTSSVPFGRRT